eukprot:g650.t1
MNGVHSYQVPSEAAADSWFVGYRWEVVLQNCPSGGDPLHLGWRFTSTSNRLDSFYGVIVAYNEQEKIEADSGVRIPFAEKMKVGVPAPTWMIALLGLKQFK